MDENVNIASYVTTPSTYPVAHLKVTNCIVPAFDLEATAPLPVNCYSLLATPLRFRWMLPSQ